ncbi:hypothetical protein EVA_06932 [gut metagenome]|uniref:Uncharacterized protein n=1 Tax=gut metagenome TaxID=749906 RepID=J9GDK4_9ZZZZ
MVWLIISVNWSQKGKKNDRNPGGLGVRPHFRNKLQVLISITT